MHAANTRRQNPATVEPLVCDDAAAGKGGGTLFSMRLLRDQLLAM
jgi:hypothetical protein